MKTCRHCLIERDASTFHRSARTSDGLHSWCKDCVRQAVRESRAKKPDKIRAQGRAQYWKKLDERRAYALAYRAKDVALANEKAAAWRRKNPERVRENWAAWAKANPLAPHASQLRRYGLTPETYAAILKKQGERCAICLLEQTVNRRMYVDHCHTSGKVRGLLCHHCNTAIGLMRDDAARMRRAISYLEDAGMPRAVANACVTGS